MQRIIKRLFCLSLLIVVLVSVLSGVTSAIGNLGTPASDAIDATSVKFHWTPYAGTTEYKIYRGGTFIGSTISTTGYYNDFNLSPSTAYQYRVDAVNNIGTLLAQSNNVTFTTTNSSTIKTTYKVLAVAFSDIAHFTTDDYNNAKTFLQYRIDFLKKASRGYAVFEPYKVNPGDDPLIWIQQAPPLDGAGNVDHVAAVTTVYPQFGNKTIVDLIEKGDIDCVWVVKCSTSGFGENVPMGNTDPDGDGIPNRVIGSMASTGEKWIPIQVKCSRIFFINDYTPHSDPGWAGDTRSWDGYTHMVEGIMSSMCDSFTTNWPRSYSYNTLTFDINDQVTTINRSLHLFERFRLADEWAGGACFAARGNGNLGSSHFPPNSRRTLDLPYYDGDYAYNDILSRKRSITCFADDWFNYPNFLNVSRTMNGYDYGDYVDYKEGSSTYFVATDHSPDDYMWAGSSYHLWWFSHIPSNSGVTNGKLNSWWPYLYDFNRFNGTAINYTVNGFLTIPTTYNPVSSEYGTEDSNGNNWWYWHAANYYGPTGAFSVSTTTKKTGSYALKLNINCQEDDPGGRGDITYPRYQNANWNLSGISSIKFSIKLDTNPSLIDGVNPIVRLCTNGGNRIELVPKSSGVYTNLFDDTSLRDANGWYNFVVPVSGSAAWQRINVGSPDLQHINYVQISVKGNGHFGDSYSYYFDDLEFVSGITGLTVDSFSNQTKWQVNQLNDLNQSVSWSMDGCNWGGSDPGYIQLNSYPANQYYRENINQSIVGNTYLVLRLKDWYDSDTETHWNIVLNDGADHTVLLSTYGNVTGSWTDISIPLSAFGANLANIAYLKIVHKDAISSALLIDNINFN